jgi:hypothetical protein
MRSIVLVQAAVLEAYRLAPDGDPPGHTLAGL